MLHCKRYGKNVQCFPWNDTHLTTTDGGLEKAIYTLVRQTTTVAVSYTHLDVYKRQVLLYTQIYL